MASPTPGNCTLTARRRPAVSVARCTWPMLAAATGRRLDDSSPFVDTRLPDGTRVHAALATQALAGDEFLMKEPPKDKRDRRDRERFDRDDRRDRDRQTEREPGAVRVPGQPRRPLRRGRAWR